MFSLDALDVQSCRMQSMMLAHLNPKTTSSTPQTSPQPLYLPVVLEQYCCIFQEALLPAAVPHTWMGWPHVYSSVTLACTHVMYSL